MNLYLGVRVRKFILLLSFVLVYPILTNFALADINMNLITEDFYLSPGSYVLQIQTEKDGTYGMTALGSYRSWVNFENNYIAIRNGYKEVNFSINPPDRIKAGIYKFPIMIYLIENDSIYSIEDYRLLIEDKTEVKITELKVNKDTFSPGDKIEVTGTVKNTGTSDLEELRLYIKLEGDRYEDMKEKLFSLNIDEEKGFEEIFDTSLHPDPGTYKISLTLMKFSQKMDSRKRVVEIERIGKIEKVHDSSWKLIQESGSFYMKNVGNVEKTEKIEMEVTKPWDWFAFFSEMPEIIDMDTKVVFVWEVTLDRGESKTINYNIHYWPFIILTIVAIYGLYLALRQIKKPSLRKHSIQTKILEDEKREVMVALEVKSGGKKMNDVVVEDRIPFVAQLIKDFKTIKPSIKQTDEGTIVKWKLNNLGKRENIILTYKFRTLVGTVGYFKLPKAVLKARINKVKQEYFSNSLKIKEE